MTTETPAATIRRAVAKMREVAHRADTGEPWESSKHYDALWTVDLKPSPGSVDALEPAENTLGRDDCASFEQPRFFSVLHEHATHIASWHPLVALAVADWLDEVAADSHASLDAWVEQAALKVARAYLGEAHAS